MNQSSAREQRLRDLLGTDLPANELRRLAHADAQLRLTAAYDRDQAAKEPSGNEHSQRGSFPPVEPEHKQAA